MQQKLVTIPLSGERRHFEGVTEHLDDYLKDGWVIKSVDPAGYTDTTEGPTGFIVVLMEKN